MRLQNINNHAVDLTNAKEVTTCVYRLNRDYYVAIEHNDNKYCFGHFMNSSLACKFRNSLAKHITKQTRYNADYQIPVHPHIDIVRQKDLKLESERKQHRARLEELRLNKQASHPTHTTIPLWAFDEEIT